MILTEKPDLLPAIWNYIGHLAPPGMVLDNKTEGL